MRNSPRVARVAYVFEASGIFGRFLLPVALTLYTMKGQGKLDEERFFAVVFDIEMLVEGAKELERAKARGADDGGEGDDEDMFQFFRDDLLSDMYGFNIYRIQLPGVEMLKLIEVRSNFRPASNSL